VSGAIVFLAMSVFVLAFAVGDGLLRIAAAVQRLRP